MNTLKFPNHNDVETQAADWIAAIDRGLSGEEQVRLDHWLDESPIHGEALIKCASMFDLLDILQPISKLMPMGDELRPVHYPKQDKRWWPSVAAAACLIAIFSGVGGLAYTYLPKDTPAEAQLVLEPSPQRYQTSVGEISTVVLSDGSLLQLNTDSEVAVRYDETRRHIELHRGEVFFDVAKNPNKPFVVEAGSERVTAVGTAFSVDASRQSATEVIVTEGKVRVNHRGTDAGSRYDDVFLTPGQKVVVRNNRPEISVGEDADALLAWREGMLVFQGESLAEVIKEIDRYTPLSFKLLDTDIAAISVGGFFKAGDLDQLLLVLENNFDVASTRHGNEIRLSKVNR